MYDQEVGTLHQAHMEQREEEKQTAEQKRNEIQVSLMMDRDNMSASSVRAVINPFWRKKGIFFNLIKVLAYCSEDSKLVEILGYPCVCACFF